MSARAIELSTSSPGLCPLSRANPFCLLAQRANWRIAGAGYGIHWPDLDEDLATQGLLQGARAPRGREVAA